MKKKKTTGKVADFPRVEIGLLKPYKNNPRKHSDDQIARLVGSLQEFGWTRPIIVDDKFMILAGHGMFEAAKAAGDTEVPVVIKTGLTAKQKRAYVIADNKLGERSTWDEDLLKLELQSLDADLLELVGFKEHELQSLLRPGDADASLDDPVDQPGKTQVKAGDVWALGKHRLMCGDSTSREDVTKLLAGAKPHLMVTDPPYGVEYDASWREGAGVNKNKKKMGKVTNDERIDWSAAYNLFPGDVVYIWHADRYASEVQRSIVLAGFEVVSQIIWAKDRPALSRGDYHWKHEPCWYAVRKGKNHKWNGGRSQNTLWEIPSREDDGHGHSTQKPVECMRRPILNNSRPGEGVYDPFVGSGTTLIACAAEDRVCYAMEISPEYCQIVINRWEKISGAKAQKCKQ